MPIAPQRNRLDAPPQFLINPRGPAILPVEIMNTDILRIHRKELAETPFPIYRLFDLVDAQDMDHESRASINGEIAPLIDLILFQELSVRIDTLCGSAGKVLELPPALAAQAFRSWRETLEGATKSRGAMRMISHRFGEWLSALRPLTLESALQLLPAIAPVIGDLKDDGVAETLRALDRGESGEDRIVITTALAAYGSTTAPIVSGCCRIAAKAIQWNRKAEFTTLLEKIQVRDMEESVDSERLVPAIADFCDLCATVEPSIWPLAFDLALLITSQNHSSAYKATRGLRRLIPRLDAGTVPAYLSDVHSLVSQLGVRTVGFAMRRLPRFYAEHGADRTREFVQTAAAMAQTNGINAAQLFIEGKTAVSRNFFRP